MDNEIKVSVICTAYNHEPYIRQCLDGFVMQKTDFRFEVIVHDDASTDRTAKIIREYAEKYPDIIVPIYQKENQYSQGIKIFKTFIQPKIHGKYLASCEGDDCWTDCKKLQKQFDFMESHPEYSLCVHNATTHFCDGSHQDYITPNIKEDRDFSLAEIMEGDAALFATNSAFRRAEITINIPSCFAAKGFGDLQMFLYSAIVGKVHCLADNMSQYNSGTRGSWTERVWKNPDKKVEHLQEKIRMLKAVDKYYNGQFKELFDKKILFTQYLIYEAQNDFQKMSEEPFKTMHKKRKKENRRAKFVTYIDNNFPWVRKLWESIKEKNHE